jgi:8-oxo-dGTP pyrophosphatase MutT (NUDIX family)
MDERREALVTLAALFEGGFGDDWKPPPGWEPPPGGNKKSKIIVVHKGKSGSYGKPTYSSHKPKHSGKPKKHPPHKDADLPTQWEVLKQGPITLLQTKLDVAKKMLKHCATPECQHKWQRELDNIVFLLNKKLQAAQPKEYKPVEKWISAGGVVVPSLRGKDIDYVYIRKPSKGFGPWSFPKGKVDEGESFGKAARREVEEESGIQAHILPGGYIGQGIGSFSITHYYLMVQTGGNPSRHDTETEKVRLVHWKEAMEIFKRVGNKRDALILEKARKKIEKIKAKQSHRSKGRTEGVLTSLQSLGEIKPPRIR